MAKRRKAALVTLTGSQRERLESLWFVFGNRGPKTTPGNHQFIQGLLEHGLDLRPLQTKRTPKKDRPTEECEAAVNAVLASTGGDEAGASRLSLIRLPPTPGGERRAETPNPELKRMLDEKRRRLSAGRDRGELDTDG